jgi:uncharacterized damage-inducible protein DinB
MNTGDLPLILSSLEATPSILRHLVESVPADRLKLRRIPGKWSIHEHACHMRTVHPLMMKRLTLFEQEISPEIRPVIPGTTDDDSHLIHENLEEALNLFDRERVEFVAKGRSLTPEFLARKARHAEYDIYTPYHLFRHILMHDHLHLYRIEELAYTTDAYLRKS